MTPSVTPSWNLYVWMYVPNTSRVIGLSFRSSGVPVKPMKMASFSQRFICLFMSPPCVRWHSSTNT